MSNSTPKPDNDTDTAVSIPALNTQTKEDDRASGRRVVKIVNWVVIALLFGVLLAYTAYRVIEFRDQPTLNRQETLAPEPNGKSPVPGFGLCCLKSTPGGCQLNYAMPDGQPGGTQDTKDGRFTCLTYFQPQTPVLQNGPGNGWAFLSLPRTGRTSPVYMLMFPSRIDIDSYPPDLIGDYIDDTTTAKVAYNIIKTVPLGSSEKEITTTISGITSTRSANSTGGSQNSYLVFRATDTNPPLNRQWQPIKVVGIVADIATFLGGTLLVVYYIVMGRGRYRSWGLVQQVARVTPRPVDVERSEDLGRVVGEFLDVRVERKYY
ncbi:hypothetical protein HDV00_010025 [Rhizophlyctis rosea]|nr:hypothetical protein HDV00_010025 [Rhizophlyctis rosea]